MKVQDEKSAYSAEGRGQTERKKEAIVQRLRERGCRVTKQRLMLLDIILADECSCCKEIYYRASVQDDKIGMATVYRMVNTLEEIGAISRKNMYKVVCGEACETEDTYTIEFDDGTVACLSAEAWYQIVSAGLRECGFMQGRELCRVSARA